jgi:hypothetical protein
MLRPGLVVVALALAAAAGPASDVVRVERVRADIEFLSSDALQGRLSLDRSADVAVQFIATEFKKAGLSPASGDSFLQPYTLIAYRPHAPAQSLELIRNGETKAFHAPADFTGGFVRKVDVKAPLAFVGYGITAPEYGYDDYGGIDVRGKVVLMFDHEPQETDPASKFNGTGHTVHGARSTKLVNAQRHGAVAVLIASEPLRKHPGLFDRQRTTPARGSAPLQALDGWIDIPAFSISDQVFGELIAPLKKTPAELQRAIDGPGRPMSQEIGESVVVIHTANSEARTGASFNAVGLIEGSDPKLKSEAILLTAHYDHLGTRNGSVYPGANDNASGTAGVMELARMFAASAARPKRTLLFIVFGSEEEGMLGSHYYCNHPLRPLETTRAVINLDMIARDEAHIPQSEGVVEIPADTSNELNLVGTFYSPELRRVVERENGGVGLLLDTKFDRDHDLNALFRCDHFPFLVHRVPAVWFFGGWHPGYHEPSDTVDKLNFTKIEKVIRLAYRSAMALANAAETPRFE